MEANIDNAVSISQPMVPIFKGDNYQFWSIKVKTSHSTELNALRVIIIFREWKLFKTQMEFSCTNENTQGTC